VDVESKVVSIEYSREYVINYLKTIKLVYSLILKSYIRSSNSLKNPSIYRATNIAEVERIKSELFIDRMLAGTTDEHLALNKYAVLWNRPALINLKIDNNVPYIFLNDVLKNKKYDKDILIAPFTKIKDINLKEEKVIEKNSKVAKVYDIELEKQVLDELTYNERNGLYTYILENAYSIKRKIEECIGLEKENVANFENIRKLEQLLSKYENTIEEKETSKEYSDVERENDYDDIARINRELEEIKRTSTNLFELRKENIEFVNIWKRNIAVYMIAECREIEKKFEEAMHEEKNDISGNDNITNVSEDKYEDEDNSDELIDGLKINGEKVDLSEINDTDIKDDISDTDTVNSDIANSISNEVVENVVEDTKIVNSLDEEKEINEEYKKIIDESKENVDSAEQLLDNISKLISKQQNHAKIAGNIGASYSALNNAFEMKKAAEKLLELLQNLDLKIKAYCNENSDNINLMKVDRISKNNIEINTLFNYLNNPKIVASNVKATRFDEMAIIEENELKRCIAEKIREIRGEAELKKLRDDLDYIDEKGGFQKIIGIFTGDNKLDNIRREQIDIRQNAIRRTLSKKMNLAYNYSIHELMAEIKMFINENEDDELIEDDVLDLKAIADELKRNFVILESKVESIVEKKEGKNYPVDSKKMSRGEILEIDTYRFLNKYKYDLPDDDKKEPEYQDTMTSEITRIIEYINASNIL
jgi:hypothetical protein